MPVPARIVTDEEKEAFYSSVASTGIIGASALKSGIGYSREKRLREIDPLHVPKTEAALEVFRARIEAEILRRGVEGVAKPLSFRGRLTGDTEQVYSDHLLLALAKRHIPAYRSGESAQTSSTMHAIGPDVLDISKLSREKRIALRTLLGPDKEDDIGPVEEVVEESVLLTINDENE